MPHIGEARPGRIGRRRRSPTVTPAPSRTSRLLAGPGCLKPKFWRNLAFPHFIHRRGYMTCSVLPAMRINGFLGTPSSHAKKLQLPSRTSKHIIKFGNSD